MEIKFTLSQEQIDSLFEQAIKYLGITDEDDIKDAECVYSKALREYATETSLMFLEDAAKGHNDTEIDTLSYYLETELNRLKGRPRLAGIIKEVV